MLLALIVTVGIRRRELHVAGEVPRQRGLVHHLWSIQISSSAFGPGMKLVVEVLQAGPLALRLKIQTEGLVLLL